LTLVEFKKPKVVDPESFRKEDMQGADGSGFSWKMADRRNFRFDVNGKAAIMGA
jgi:hypothetical protein